MEKWTRRTDLAIEAKEIWAESAAETTQLPGVRARDILSHGYDLTIVEIHNQQGAEALGKEEGKYITIELGALIRREEDAFSRGVYAIGQQLESLLDFGETDTVLVVGLGNPQITPDAIGPIVAKHTLATKHLVEHMPEHFGTLRPVTVLQTGVLGTTGLESGQIVKALVDDLRPSCVIAVDALASRKLSRVCRTVQISNTGIAPGSGIGNARMRLNQETLGIPVIALGVPTVVDAGTLAADLLEEHGHPEQLHEKFRELGGGMIVTPKEIDTQVADISKLLGYAINFALHENLSVQDIDMLSS